MTAERVPLSDRAAGAVERVRRLADINRLAGEADRVRTRADELSLPLAELDPLVAVADGMRQRGIRQPSLSTSVRALATQLAELETRYGSDPSQITAPDGRLRFSLWDPLRTLPDELRQNLREAWREHVATIVPRPRPEILDVLENIPGLQADARRIRALAAELDLRSSALPQEDADFVRIEQLGSELEALWQALEGGGIPEDVLRFLAAASLDGAALNLLTPSVRAWLEDRSLLQYARVRFVTR